MPLEVSKTGTSLLRRACSHAHRNPPTSSPPHSYAQMCLMLKLSQAGMSSGSSQQVCPRIWPCSSAICCYHADSTHRAILNVICRGRNQPHFPHTIPTTPIHASPHRTTPSDYSTPPAPLYTTHTRRQEHHTAPQRIDHIRKIRYTSLHNTTIEPNWTNAALPCPYFRSCRKRWSARTP